MWLGQVVGIRAGTVTEDFPEDVCAASASGLKSLQTQDRCALTKAQSVSMNIERATLSWRKGLQGVKTGE
jgi:hypothetical protein